MSALGNRVGRGMVCGTLGAVAIAALGLPFAPLALLAGLGAGVIKGLSEESEEHSSHSPASQDSKSMSRGSFPSWRDANISPDYGIGSRSCGFTPPVPEPSVSPLSMCREPDPVLGHYQLPVREIHQEQQLHGGLREHDVVNPVFAHDLPVEATEARPDPRIRNEGYFQRHPEERM